MAAEDRLQLALRSFGSGSFSRKDYLALFPTLSTATASRDLAAAVSDGRLVRSGEQAKARYQSR